MTYRDCIAEGLRQCGVSEAEIQRKLDRADLMAPPSVANTRRELDAAAADMIATVKHDFLLAMTPAGQACVIKEIEQLQKELYPKN